MNEKIHPIHGAGSPVYLWLATGLLGLITLLVGINTVLTFNAVMKKKICVAEG